MKFAVVGSWLGSEVWSSVRLRLLERVQRTFCSRLSAYGSRGTDTCSRAEPSETSLRSQHKVL